jgi:hypothetical protein
MPWLSGVAFCHVSPGKTRGFFSAAPAGRQTTNPQHKQNHLHKLIRNLQYCDMLNDRL